ncbi:DUF3892 domain-containing protein [Kribbella pratensis]|jgi:hypothetical protein|uniref:DUF3892 domain-containing protein n=1 Tax=Kribbella pratensis TaxID=2512112 RepID=A0A4R8C133_9ACTN|nr:DUF3892 domain-containing protein [Kribbella pratensis]TDW69419.1 hypothetical protein EV653_3443 [Kribbella pratensis]
MASLASYTTLYVTAVGLNGEPDLKHIAAVRWDPGSLDPEESSLADFVRWLDRGAGRAFVRRADGTRGPRVRVNSDGTIRYLRSNPDDVSNQDELLLLPTWQLHRSKKHSRRV